LYFVIEILIKCILYNTATVPYYETTADAYFTVIWKTED